MDKMCQGDESKSTSFLGRFFLVYFLCSHERMEKRKVSQLLVYSLISDPEHHQTDLERKIILEDLGLCERETLLKDWVMALDTLTFIMAMQLSPVLEAFLY